MQRIIKSMNSDMTIEIMSSCEYHSVLNKTMQAIKFTIQNLIVKENS